MVKRDVYNGYEEHYMTGMEIKKYFEGCYETSEKHHSVTSDHTIDFSKDYSRVKDNVTYRLFINDCFCKIMNGETDTNVYFFGYTREKLMDRKNS